MGFETKEMKEMMDGGRFLVKELICPKFSDNGRSEVVSALTDGIAANYAYDAVGNRLVSANGGFNASYSANALNQYATVTTDGVATPVTYGPYGAMTRFGAYSYSCTERNNRIGLVSTNRPNGSVANLCRSGCDGINWRVWKRFYLPSGVTHRP